MKKKILLTTCLIFLFSVAQSQLSGIVTVGSGDDDGFGDGDFATFKGDNGLIRTINDGGGLTGNLTVIVNNDITETGSNSSIQGVNLNGFSITITPDGAVMRTITLNGNGIHFVACSNIIIDGSFGGIGRFLKFVNPDDNGETFEIDTRIDNLTIQNCELESNADLNTEGIIDFAATTDTQGYDNILIHNNIMRDAAGQNTLGNAIYIREPSTAGTNHDNIIISNNDFEITGKRAIYLDRAVNNSATISNVQIIRNSFFSPTPVSLTNTEELIRIEEIDGLTISGNFFGGTDKKATGGNLIINYGTENNFKPIYFTSYITPSSINVLDSNVFANIQLVGQTGSACDAIMMDLDDGTNSVGTTYGNFFGDNTVDASSNPSIALVSRSDGSDLKMIELNGNVTNSISKNVIGGLSITSDQTPSKYGTLRIIYVGGTKTLAINGNVIGNTNIANNIYQETDRHIYGIYANNNGVANITNNFIGSITTAGDYGDIGNIYCIRSSNSSIKTIVGNTVGNSSVDAVSNANIKVQANTGDVYLYGIYTNNNGSIVTVSNNTIGGIKATAIAADKDANVYGIYATGSQSGDLTYTGNLIGSAIQNGNIHQSTRGSLRGIFCNANAVNATISNNSIEGLKMDGEFGDNLFSGIFLNNKSYSGSVIVTNNNIGSSMVNATTNPSIDVFVGYADPSPNTVSGIYIAPNASISTTIVGNTIAGFRVTSSSINERAYFKGIYTNRNPGTNWNISNNLIGSHTQVNSIVQETNLAIYGIQSAGQGDHIYTGNTIKGIKMQGNATGEFRGIYHNEPVNYNVTIANNTIGDNNVDASNSPNIDLGSLNSTTLKYSYGFYVATGANVFIENNTIGGIRMTGATSTDYISFRGIYHGSSSTTGNVSIQNNNIGNTGISNNIYKECDGSLYGIYGGIGAISGTQIISNNNIGGFTTENHFDDLIRSIYISGTSLATTISDNTISNYTIVNGTSTSSFCTAIRVNQGINTIHNNQINNFNLTSSYTGTIFRGIYSNTALTGQIISNNIITNITENNAVDNDLRGIMLANASTGGIVFNNRISDLENNDGSTHQVYGIYNYNGDWDVYNNVILLGEDNSGNSTYYGIYHRNNTVSSNTNYWFNTVEIKGSVSSGARATYCFLRSSNSNNIQLRNNLFTNNRAGGTGSHYAIRNQLGSFPWDCDNNTIAAINPSNLAMWGSTALDFTSWQVASGQDVNSNSGTVQVDAIGIPLTSTDWAIVDGFGAPVTITTDITNADRDAATPDCGAYENIFSWSANSLTDKTNWFDGSNWSGGTIPLSTDNIMIPTNPAGGNFFPNINAPGAVCQNITIEENASVTISGNNELTVSGLWNNLGAFTPNQSIVTFNGTSRTQTINSTTPQNFFDITFNNPNGVTIESGEQSITGTLTLSSGDFSTGDSVTFISDVNGTARIAEITGGSIIGRVTTQRYIDAGETNWRFLTHPVQNADLEQFDDDFLTSGIPGSDYPLWPSAVDPFESMIFYDETAGTSYDDGFQIPSSTSEIIEPGQGVWIWCGDTIIGTNPFTIDATGVPNQGDINLPVTFTSASGNMANDGWNMVANPYMCPIDWLDSDWTKTNIENAIYIWNPDIAQYATFVGGVGLNGGDQYIASSQAFWVHADAANPILTATEGIKHDTDQPFIKSTFSLDLLKLEIAKNGVHADEMVIRFDDNLTNGFDSEADARIFQAYQVNSARINSSYNGVDYSINSLQTPTGLMEIPVTVNVPSSGTYELNVTEIDAILPFGCVVIEDLVTGTVLDLKTAPSYSFYANITNSGPRFMIKVVNGFNADDSVLACNGDNNGQIEVNLDGVTSFELTENGNSIATENAINGAATFNNLTAGEYVVSVQNLVNGCPNINDTITIYEPTELAQNSVLTDETCAGCCDGNIDLTVSGGTPVYSIHWFDDNNQPLADGNNLCAGDYITVIVDGNGCSLTGNFTIYNNVTSSISEEDKLVGNIYPNPVKDMLTIELKENVDQIILINSIGQEVKTIANPQLTETISFYGLSKGMYYLRINSENEVSTLKVLVE